MYVRSDLGLDSLFVDNDIELVAQLPSFIENTYNLCDEIVHLVTVSFSCYMTLNVACAYELHIVKRDVNLIIPNAV